jgi:hypothetical protein
MPWASSSLSSSRGCRTLHSSTKRQSRKTPISEEVSVHVAALCTQLCVVCLSVWYACRRGVPGECVFCSSFLPRCSSARLCICVDMRVCVSVQRHRCWALLQAHHVYLARSLRHRCIRPRSCFALHTLGTRVFYSRFNLPTLRTTLRALPCSSDFQRMCDVVGVDALASQKGFWSEMFGVGDFYYKLGVSIVDVCLSTRGKNGGIMPIEDLLARVEERSGCVDPPHTSLVNSDFVCECCSILAHARGFLLKMEHMQQQATCVIFLYLLSRSSLT